MLQIFNSRRLGCTASGPAGVTPGNGDGCASLLPESFRHVLLRAVLTGVVTVVLIVMFLM